MLQVPGAGKGPFHGSCVRLMHQFQPAGSVEWTRERGSPDQCAELSFQPLWFFHLCVNHFNQLSHSVLRFRVSEPLLPERRLSPVPPPVPGAARSSLISRVWAVSRKSVTACPKSAPLFPNLLENSRQIASAPPMQPISGVKCLTPARKPVCSRPSAGPASSTKQ